MTSSLHLTGASPGILKPFWEADLPARLGAFADLRDRAGMAFHEMDGDGQGFWSVTGYADAVAVTRNPALYSNARGFSLDDMSQQLLDTMASIIGMDDPRHKQQRKLVQGAFTMRAIAALTDNVTALSDVIVEDLRELGEFDFVDAVASKLPLQVICDLLSIPASDRPHLRVLVDRVLGVSDPSFGGPQQGVEAVIELFGYAIELGRERQADPGDDLTSLLMSAEVDGHRLTPTEFGSFLILMIAAGNDTTRTGLAWAIHLLSENPDQQHMLAADFDGLQANAIEEILRWSSPVLHMRRTATQDTAIGDVAVSEGDKIVLWYLAANHDPAVFDDPDAFDITRYNATKQIAFGGGGPHFCLGANLARMEIRVVLQKLLEAFPEMHATAPPDLLLSQFVHGVKALPCTIR